MSLVVSKSTDKLGFGHLFYFQIFGKAHDIVGLLGAYFVCPDEMDGCV